jgi:flavodoxin
MIYYFTGTGNSLYVAQRLAELTGTGLASIAEIMGGRPMPAEDEVTGIVYPIYGWGAPKMVLDFTENFIGTGGYMFSVCTCGDDAGHAMKRLEKALGRKLDSAFSITMPNNYISLPGFDVDSEADAKQKLLDAEGRIAEIAEIVKGRKSGVYDVHEGGAGAMKSAIVTPLFAAFATSDRSFYAEDACTGCKKCEGVCPTRNIRVDEKPVWGGNCTCCLACLHHCPVRAIQRGKGTKTKGRFINPNCRVGYDFS